MHHKGKEKFYLTGDQKDSQSADIERNGELLNLNARPRAHDLEQSTPSSTERRKLARHQVRNLIA